MKYIVVPLDGSLLAEQVLPYVRELAPLFGAHVILTQVLDDDGHDPLLTEAFVAQDLVGIASGQFERQFTAKRVTQQQEARAYLEHHAARLRHDGTFSCEAVLRFGAPAEVITELADNGETLVAMATHGYSGVRRLALGSVADQVVQTSKAPVLLIRSSSPACSPRFRRVLVPLDGSPLAQQALPLAIELAGKSGGSLALLRAIEPMIDRYTELQPFGYTQPPDEEWIIEQRAAIKRDLANRAELVRARFPNTRAVVIDGYPAPVITKEADRMDADVIVMATHGRGGLGRLALGSVADTVLHTTYTPLLLVHGV